VLHEPPILFLDEPTSGVDPLSRRRFWDLIYALAEAGTTVFVSTHYMEEAEYCDRLALMNRGRLIALDTPRGLREGGGEPLPPLLELRVDSSHRAVEALQGAPGLLEVGMFGRTVHATASDLDAALERIPGILRERGVALHGMAPIAPSLEDVFIARVREQGGVPDA
jgi:ABC-2 type transport system ATP-binding protein